MEDEVNRHAKDIPLASSLGDELTAFSSMQYMTHNQYLRSMGRNFTILHESSKNAQQCKKMRARLRHLFLRISSLCSHDKDAVGKWTDERLLEAATSEIVRLAKHGSKRSPDAFDGRDAGRLAPDPKPCGGGGDDDASCFDAVALLLDEL